MQVIAGCFASKEVMNWIISEADKQDDTVTFSDFVNKLRDHFLDRNREVNVQRELLSEMIPKDIKYTDWAAGIKIGIQLWYVTVSKARDICRAC